MQIEPTPVIRLYMSLTARGDAPHQNEFLFILNVRSFTSQRQVPKNSHSGPIFLNVSNVSGVESEILTKYKRIKWAPNHKALHLLPGG